MRATGGLHTPHTMDTVPSIRDLWRPHGDTKRLYANSPALGRANDRAYCQQGCAIHHVRNFQPSTCYRKRATTTSAPSFAAGPYVRITSGTCASNQLSSITTIAECRMAVTGSTHDPQGRYMNAGGVSDPQGCSISNPGGGNVATNSMAATLWRAGSSAVQCHRTKICLCKRFATSTSAPATGRGATMTTTSGRYELVDTGLAVAATCCRLVPTAWPIIRNGQCTGGMFGRQTQWWIDHVGRSLDVGGAVPGRNGIKLCLPTPGVFYFRRRTTTSPPAACYASIHRDRLCSGGVLPGRRYGNLALGTQASRSACQQTCDSNNRCRYYLWKNDPSAANRYECTTFSSCTSTTPYGDGDGGNIYRKMSCSGLAAGTLIGGRCDDDMTNMCSYPGPYASTSCCGKTSQASCVRHRSWCRWYPAPRHSQLATARMTIEERESSSGGTVVIIIVVICAVGLAGCAVVFYRRKTAAARLDQVQMNTEMTWQAGTPLRGRKGPRPSEIKWEAGRYTIVHEGTSLDLTLELGTGRGILQFSMGEVVDVVDVTETSTRIRGQVEQKAGRNPKGWISLKNKETGYLWARPTLEGKKDNSDGIIRTDGTIIFGEGDDGPGHTRFNSTDLRMSPPPFQDKLDAQGIPSGLQEPDLPNSNLALPPPTYKQPLNQPTLADVASLHTARVPIDMGQGAPHGSGLMTMRSEDVPDMVGFDLEYHMESRHSLEEFNRAQAHMEAAAQTEPRRGVKGAASPPPPTFNGGVTGADGPVSLDAVIGTAAGPTSIADEIMKLKSLLDQGILSKEEFDAAKGRVIDAN